MKINKLAQFSIDDIRRTNAKMVARSANNGRIVATEGVIELKAGRKTKVISTKVNSSQIKESWARATKK